MKKLLIKLVASAALVLAANANAGLISGAHLTDGGKNVNLSGLTWHTWDIANISRDSVESQMVVGGIYEEYRYATRGEFEALFDSLWGGTHEGWHVSNADGGNWLRDNFGGLIPLASTGSNVFYGSMGECSTNPSISE